MAVPCLGGRTPLLRALRFVVSWSLLLGYIYVLYRALTESASIPSGMSDKTVHAIAFGVLALLATWAFGTVLRQPLLSGLAAFALAALYGAFGEWVQSFIPSRKADLVDWYADTLGAGIAVLLVLLWVLIRRSSKAAREQRTNRRREGVPRA
ncbi:hypothetical protein FJZ36_14105 [Candidatus Poribacteria bacterium]|nr:hypothetical protein [Candidatus Poribacteria bacterium]